MANTAEDGNRRSSFGGAPPGDNHMLPDAVCFAGRVGTKATTTYRVYSNAFMEGRQQDSRLGRGNGRSGIPSIQSTSVTLRQPAWSRSVSNPSLSLPDPPVFPSCIKCKYQSCDYPQDCRVVCLLEVTYLFGCKQSVHLLILAEGSQSEHSKHCGKAGYSDIWLECACRVLWCRQALLPGRTVRAAERQRRPAPASARRPRLSGRRPST